MSRTGNQFFLPDNFQNYLNASKISSAVTFPKNKVRSIEVKRFSRSVVWCFLPISCTSKSSMGIEAKKSPNILAFSMIPCTTSRCTSINPAGILIAYLKLYWGEKPKFQSQVSYFSSINCSIPARSSRLNW